MHVNKMLCLIHCLSGILLRCVYRTCSYRDDDENSIYQAVLVDTGTVNAHLCDMQIVLILTDSRRCMGAVRSVQLALSVTYNTAVGERTGKSETDITD